MLIGQTAGHRAKWPNKKEACLSCFAGPAVYGTNTYSHSFKNRATGHPLTRDNETPSHALFKGNLSNGLAKQGRGYWGYIRLLSL